MNKDTIGIYISFYKKEERSEYVKITEVTPMYYLVTSCKRPFLEFWILKESFKKAEMPKVIKVLYET